MNINLEHKIDTNFMKLDSVYFNNLGVGFIIKSTQFYLSSFQLIDTITQEVVTVSDTTIINTGEYIRDDMTYFSRTVPSATAGTVTAGKNFHKILFRMGNRLEVNEALPSDFITNHALAVKSPAMYDSLAQKFIDVKLQLINPLQPDVVKEIQWNESPTSLLLDYYLSTTSGYDVDIALELDYLKWFSDIDFWNSSDEIIIAKLRENLANSFSKKE